VKRVKVKIKCTKCNWEAVIEVKTSPIGSLKPNEKVKGGGIKIKMSKEQIDKIMDAAGGLGASRDELEQLGISIPIPEWKEAEERRKLRRFVRKHLKVCREKRKAAGEKHQVSTAPWEMGDSFKDIDLSSSEVKSMGIEDMRLIPGVTLQKRVYETTKGQDKEVLKGIKFFCIIDVSGSMFSVGHASPGKLDKVHKALMMAEEVYKICKKLGYDYNLALFSDRAVRIPKKTIKRFFREEEERKKYSVWNGGTTLSAALDLYSLEELKDGNLMIFSDMDIADLTMTRARFQKIGEVTNSFKVVIIEYSSSLSETRIKQTEDLFPDKKVEILRITV